jgi:autotransporter-associated beta strand protein
MILGSANTYTGSTRVTAGSVVAAAGAGSALGATNAITIESGGTLSLGANNQINDMASITLAGGSFSKGNFSEGSATAAGMGSLNLTADSTIDFGTGTTGTLTFAIFNPGANYLTIDNWTGTPSTIGDATTDRLIFNSDPTTNLLQFLFSGYEGAVVFDIGGGAFEVTPLEPVPEINPALLSAIVCGGAIFVARRRARIRS